MGNPGVRLREGGQDAEGSLGSVLSLRPLRGREGARTAQIGWAVLKSQPGPQLAGLAARGWDCQMGAKGPSPSGSMLTADWVFTGRE